MVADNDGVVRTPGVLGGEPRIDGRRVSVRQVATMVQERGLSARDVADQFDLDLTDVEVALEYARENPEEMARVRERRAGIVAEHRDDAVTNPAELRRSAEN